MLQTTRKCKSIAKVNKARAMYKLLPTFERVDLTGLSLQGTCTSCQCFSSKFATILLVWLLW